TFVRNAPTLALNFCDAAIQVGLGLLVIAFGKLGPGPCQVEPAEGEMIVLPAVVVEGEAESGGGSTRVTVSYEITFDRTKLCKISLSKVVVTHELQSVPRLCQIVLSFLGVPQMAASPAALQ